MYDDATLESLARELESDLVERKESAAPNDKIAQAICAFSNDLPGHRRPGVIFIGLRDDGSPAGITVDDRLLRDLGALRSDGKILPLPHITVRRVVLNGAALAVVEVHPLSEPPCAYEGRIWVRVGPRRGIASRDEERVLNERRRAADLPFDQRAVRGATLEDLDLPRVQLDYLPLAVAAEVLEANHRPLAHQLASLHLATPDGEPTVAAMLLFGQEPQRWIPGAYLQFVRFDGTDTAAPPLNQVELTGPLPRVLQRVDDLISANIRVAIEIGAHATERRHPDYAQVALQQILRNAVMHRSYEHTNAPIRWYWFHDRIEIESPGGLFGRVTVESLRDASATDYRNPTLAAAMKTMGFVQRFGVGLTLARRACAEIDAPEPEARVSANTVSMILRKGELRGAIFLDPRGALPRPAGEAFEVQRWTPEDRDEDLDRRLRATPSDAEAWRDALHDVDRAVRRVARETQGPIHVYPMAPYPLAVWLGRCLDQHARARAVILHQLVRGEGRWLTLDPRRPPEPQVLGWFLEPEPLDFGSGEGLLLTVEGTPIDELQLRAMASSGGLRRVLRLRARPGATFDTDAVATGALRQVRAACERVPALCGGAPVHVVATAPVALLVEVGRALAPTVVPSLIVLEHDAQRGHHIPRLDVGAGATL